jgi:adenylate cyclase
MFTDIVDYTALTQADESRALKLLQEEEELVRPLLTAYHGREIKSTGDGFLVEFDSALRAVQCAIDIHHHLHERNSQPGVTPIQLRIGVHLGDVEARGNDIFGDSVNLAARIEPLAESGGICISEPVFGQVRNKIPNKLERLEPKVLKNVRFSMDLYRVALPWAAQEPPSAGSVTTRLAVLPFANISPDPNDGYFADGLTEELITVLSQLRELRVIARTSVSQYRTTTKSVPQIGAELGVDAVLEGSVRKAGDQLRITVQLIDVGTQEHTWAGTYDRKLEKVFAVQSEIAKRVAKQLKVKVRAAEEARLALPSQVRPDSYLAYLKGRTLLHAATHDSLAEAKQEFERAIALDPKNAAAYSGLADTTGFSGMRYTEFRETKWEETRRRLVARAIELDPDLAEAHASLGFILYNDCDFAGAEKELKLALSINPSDSLAHHYYAEVLQEEARADEAVLQFSLAEATDPLSPFNLSHFAGLLIRLGRLDEALVKIRKLGELQPSGPDHPFLMARYNLARSDLEGSLTELARCEKVHPEPRWKPVLRALGYALSGKSEEARVLLRHEETLPEYLHSRGTMAWAYFELGDLDECFHWLEKGSGMDSVKEFQFDPRFQRVRDDPRFLAIVKRRNLG